MSAVASSGADEAESAQHMMAEALQSQPGDSPNLPRFLLADLQ